LHAADGGVVRPVGREVGRGAQRLEQALDAFDLDLERQAQRRHAVEVARIECIALHAPQLRGEQRDENHHRRDCRHHQHDELGSNAHFGAPARGRNARYSVCRASVAT
jgi:predicted rRNA methylase YqxC with S4 and FtsJ domains